MTSKERIIRKAASMYVTTGYHDLSISLLAKAVELQKATLYHHFKSKEEIFRKVVDYLLSDENELSEEDTTRSLIRAFFDAHLFFSKDEMKVLSEAIQKRDIMCIFML